jgi:hypothetical protein
MYFDYGSSYTGLLFTYPYPSLWGHLYCLLVLLLYHLDLLLVLLLFLLLVLQDLLLFLLLVLLLLFLPCRLMTSLWGYGCRGEQLASRKLTHL